MLVRYCTVDALKGHEPVNAFNLVVAAIIFSARQHAERAICYRPSVRLSVRHTGGSVENG